MSSTNNIDDDLVPEQVEGYHVGEKKTIDEYNKLDAEDESLAKWKASLGLSSTGTQLPVKAGDNRKVVVTELSLEFPEQPNLKPITINLEDSQGNTIANKEIKFEIKEKSIYQLVIKFKIQHEIITGLKYLHSVKRGGIRVDKVEEPLGSYAPNTNENPIYVKKFTEVEAPSGIIARGNYSAISKFIDDDQNVHLSLPWSFAIVK
ncbi:RDI1 [Candida pseudojiufengensis]|uniref:RDI1 n=1 Tax=Candida pseudojiufengensis TaxID=497109 RepID=UPI0022257A81|nr:RDI1 [Candida pseudojiufengensis]KAI5960987.1 RDI1 [Candida pseudojiufengensis]